MWEGQAAEQTMQAILTHYTEHPLPKDVPRFIFNVLIISDKVKGPSTSLRMSNRYVQQVCQAHGQSRRLSSKSFYLNVWCLPPTLLISSNNMAKTCPIYSFQGQTWREASTDPGLRWGCTKTERLYTSSSYETQQPTESEIISKSVSSDILPQKVSTLTFAHFSLAHWILPIPATNRNAHKG